MRRFLFSLLVLAGVSFAAGPSHSGDHVVVATLESQNGSSVGGRVILTALPHGGTNINVVATGLTAGTEYVSLYYDNGTCELEPYSQDDIIGRYTADAGGRGHTQGKVDDDLDEIHSVSVRLGSDFSLLACAAVNQ